MPGYKPAPAKHPVLQARELAILCNAEIGLIICGPKLGGTVHTYSSGPSMEHVWERYRASQVAGNCVRVQQEVCCLRLDAGLCLQQRLLLSFVRCRHQKPPAPRQRCRRTQPTRAAATMRTRPSTPAVTCAVACGGRPC